jgi:hypothetical protein
MKSRAILAISLALNVILLATVAWLASRPNTTAPAGGPVGASASADRKALGSHSSPLQNTNAIEKHTKEVMTIDWRMVESENYKQYIANLRSIGCPEETIRDIITADVNKLFEARRNELFPATNRFEYWKGGNFFTSLFDETKMTKQDALNKEKRALLKELLGVDVPDKPDLISSTKAIETILDFLPAAKQTELMEFEQKFAARTAKHMKDIQRGDTEALKKLQAEKDAELLKILGPEEKLEYDLRMSQTAMTMRMQMGDVELSEQEFRDLFKLRKAFDDEYGAFGASSNRAADRDRRNTAQKDLDSQTRQMLGDDRFLEYKYSGNLERSSLKKIAQEYNVPRTDSLKVFDVQAVAQEEATRLRQDKTMTPEQLQETLNRVRSTTEDELSKLIGRPALDAYVKEGSWIKNLNRASGSGSN